MLNVWSITMLALWQGCHPYSYAQMAQVRKDGGFLGFSGRVGSLLVHLALKDPSETTVEYKV